MVTLMPTSFVLFELTAIAERGIAQFAHKVLDASVIGLVFHHAFPACEAFVADVAWVLELPLVRAHVPLVPHSRLHGLPA